MQKLPVIAVLFTVIVGLGLAGASPPRAAAAVEWEIEKSLPLEAKPLDMVLSPDGRTLYVLAEGGTVFIFGTDGVLTDKINLNHPAERIAVDPSGERIYISDSRNRKIEVIQLDVIYSISTEGCPFKGPANAPVTMVVFSDFQ